MVLTKTLGAKICRALMEPVSLREICKKGSMPARSTVLRWLSSEEPSELEQWFRVQYARAREVQADLIVDDILELADESKGCVTPAEVQSYKLRVEARKWVASKLAPKRYGDRLELETPDLKPGEFPPVQVIIESK